MMRELVLSYTIPVGKYIWAPEQLMGVVSGGAGTALQLLVQRQTGTLLPVVLLYMRMAPAVSAQYSVPVLGFVDMATGGGNCAFMPTPSVPVPLYVSTPVIQLPSMLSVKPVLPLKERMMP